MEGASRRGKAPDGERASLSGVAQAAGACDVCAGWAQKPRGLGRGCAFLWRERARCGVGSGRDRCAVAHDEIAPAGRGGEHTVVAHLVHARRRNERGELLEQLERLERLEHDMRGAVAPAALEPVEQPAVGEPGQTLGRDRRACDVAAEPLERAAEVSAALTKVRRQVSELRS